MQTSRAGEREVLGRGRESTVNEDVVVAATNAGDAFTAQGAFPPSAVPKRYLLALPWKAWIGRQRSSLSRSDTGNSALGRQTSPRDQSAIDSLFPHASETAPKPVAVFTTHRIFKVSCKIGSENLLAALGMEDVSTGCDDSLLFILSICSDLVQANRADAPPFALFGASVDVVLRRTPQTTLHKERHRSAFAQGNSWHAQTKTKHIACVTVRRMDAQSRGLE